MFGLGIGEIAVIILIVLIVAPRDIPKIMRQAGRAFAALDRWRREAADIGRELQRPEPGEPKPARSKKTSARSRGVRRARPRRTR